MSTPVEDLGHLPDRARVEALAGFGLSAGEIACIFDLTEEALQNAFGKELTSGAIKANARVAESLYRKATGEGREAVTAAIFWLKTRARWKEGSARDNDADREPVVVRIEAYAADL